MKLCHKERNFTHEHGIDVIGCVKVYLKKNKDYFRLETFLFT